MHHTYEVVGMHCQSCVGKVTDALKNVDGITSAVVSLNPPQAQIEMDAHVPTETLNRAVQAAGGYQIVEATSASGTTSVPAAKESLFPLFLIVGYIVGTIAIVAMATGDRTPHVLMRHFMGGFFLVFSFFKMLDIRGFADAYRSYDIVARAWPAWGFVYPFAELALAAAYLMNVSPIATNIVTLGLMLVGAIGVLKALLDKRTIRCACLGTVLNLPMTKVTLIEDLGMAAMAAVTLAII